MFKQPQLDLSTEKVQERNGTGVPRLNTDFIVSMDYKIMEYVMTLNTEFLLIVVIAIHAVVFVVRTVTNKNCKMMPTNFLNRIILHTYTL